MDSSTPVATNNTSYNSNRANKKTADTDLKSSIIEFMRDRPFLWNSKHPNYKDHKRREQEFQTFSTQLNCPVKEIKRVWHVLRTNFFRAHKLIVERPQNSGENGERLWKYYLAMDYILEGSGGDDSKDIRVTKSSRNAKDNRGDTISEKESINNTTKNCSSVSSSIRSNQNDTRLSIATSQQHNSSINTSPINSQKSTSAPCQQKGAALSDTSLDADDDHLYARSLMSTLKRFDPTTKEIIKLKFQEIIVNYMQQQNVPSSQEIDVTTPEPPATSPR